jgi:hypothetical protein
MNTFKLPVTGGYTVLLAACNDEDAGAYSFSSQCFGTCLLPASTLTSMSPTSATEGAKSFTLTVKGTNFVNVESNSLVLWNGQDLVTTWVSTTELKAVVPASDLTTAGTYPITVFTPAPGGGSSNPLTFTVVGPPPAPVFTPAGGTYTATQMVTIKDANTSAKIFYAIGATATASSTPYTGAIPVTASETISAVAVASGFTSAPASASYIILPPAFPPVFSPAVGTYTSVESVSITDSTPGAIIYYAINKAPTIDSTVYSTPITVSASLTIQAFAVAAGYTNSPVASAAYKIAGSPSVLSSPATLIGPTGATLNAVINTEGLVGSCVFQYGTSALALTSATPALSLSAVSKAVPVGVPLTGLQDGTVYYYQAVVTTAGGTSSGAVLSFTTN